MKQGIEQLKEILVSGGRSDVPMQPPSKPRGQTMPPIPSDVAMTPEEPEMAAGSGGDSAALAQAVVQRTQGDVQQAISMMGEQRGERGVRCTFSTFCKVETHRLAQSSGDSSEPVWNGG